MHRFNGSVRVHAFQDPFRQGLFVIVLLLWCGGCALHQGRHEQAIGDFGRVEFHGAGPGTYGFVIGVPHGAAEPQVIDYVQAIIDPTGDGLVIAYGLKVNRIAVARPLIHQKRPPRLDQLRARLIESMHSDQTCRIGSLAHQHSRQMPRIAVPGCITPMLWLHTVS